MPCGKRRRVEGPRGRSDGPWPMIARWWEDTASACASRVLPSSRLLMLRPIRRGRHGCEAGHLAEPHHGSQLALHAAAVSGPKGVAGEEALPALSYLEEAHAPRYTGRMGGIGVAALQLEALPRLENDEIRRGDEDTDLHGDRLIGHMTNLIQEGMRLCCDGIGDFFYAYGILPVPDAFKSHTRTPNNRATSKHTVQICSRDTASYWELFISLSNGEIFGIEMDEEQRHLVWGRSLKGLKQINLPCPPKSNPESGRNILPVLVGICPPLGLRFTRRKALGNCDTSDNFTASHTDNPFVGGSQQHTLLIDEIMGADEGGSEGCTDLEKIDCYIYKQFQQMPFLRTLKTWRKKLFHGINIIPKARKQGEGDCSYYATIAAMESHFKAAYAVRSHDLDREFSVRLSTEHLKELVQDHYASKEGATLKGSQRLEICLKMAKLYGVMSEEDYNAGKPTRAKAKRYKVKSFWSLSAKDKKFMTRHLNKGEVILSSFRVSEEYLILLPHEIYRYRGPESQREAVATADRVAHGAHCIVLTGHGVVEKEKEGLELQQAVECYYGGPKTFEIESYYEYLNSYTHRWGVDGFGFVYAESLRQTYRFQVEC